MTGSLSPLQRPVSHSPSSFASPPHFSLDNDRESVLEEAVFLSDPYSPSLSSYPVSHEENMYSGIEESDDGIASLGFQINSNKAERIDAKGKGKAVSERQPRDNVQKPVASSSTKLASRSRPAITYEAMSSSSNNTSQLSNDLLRETHYVRVGIPQNSSTNPKNIKLLPKHISHEEYAYIILKNQNVFSIVKGWNKCLIGFYISVACLFFIPYKVEDYKVGATIFLGGSLFSVILLVAAMHNKIERNSKQQQKVMQNLYRGSQPV